MYGLNVAKVNTLNVEGKKKRGKHGFFRCGCSRPSLGLQGAVLGHKAPNMPMACCQGWNLNMCGQSPCLLGCRRPDYKKAFVVLNEQPAAKPGPA